MTDSEQLEAVIAEVRPPDEEALKAARERQDRLTKPAGSLGRLEELAVWLASIQRRPRPRARRKVVVVAAADHGVARRGVSAYPQAVTAQMVANFSQGGGAVNVLARHVDAEVLVVDAGIIAPAESLRGVVSAPVGPGTDDMTEGPAMQRRQALAAVTTGLRIAEPLRADAVILGDMGIGNTTAAAALTCVFAGVAPDVACGPGTGLDGEGVRRKTEIVEKALEVNQPSANDPLGTLAAVGGFELGVLAGVALRAAADGTPVVLDGYPTTAAALVAAALCPAAGAYLLASHLSAERGHRAALAHLGLTPLLDFGLRLGEGTGGLLAASMLEAAARLHDEMATFEEASVSGFDA